MNQVIEFEISGIAPLLMHSDRFVDPIAPATIEHKKLTSKRTKTIEDHKAIARSEWMGALYFDSELGVYVPSNMIRACIKEGAKLFKLGRHVDRAVIFTEHTGFSLKYKGPNDPDELYKKGIFRDSRTVKVAQARLVRTRPRFDEWSFKGNLVLNESMLSLEDLKKAFEAAGHFCGIGDCRPMLGRFDVSL